MIRIGVAQINPTVGAIFDNVKKILSAAEAACAQSAHFLLTPCLSVSGFSPQHLAYEPAFTEQLKPSLETLSSQTPVPIILNFPDVQDGVLYMNIACVGGGEVQIKLRYQLGQQPEPGVAFWEHEGVRFSVVLDDSICAHHATWFDQTDITLVLGASAFDQSALVDRCNLIGLAQAEQSPLVYANLVGGQDENVFDGGSLATDFKGKVCLSLKSFEEAVSVVVYDFKQAKALTHSISSRLEKTEAIYRSLVLSVKDYVHKNGLKQVVVGVSGGLDSALTLTIAVDALGADHVMAIMMPSAYTSSLSFEGASALTENLGIRYESVSIVEGMSVFDEMLGPVLATVARHGGADTTAENIQARFRGMILMAISNYAGSVVLATGNKSEVAVGYATLYGDTVGGFAPLKDVYKTTVYDLSRWRNRAETYGSVREVIPECIIDRAPSAELKEGQTDQDTLPPYEVLDQLIEFIIHHDSDESMVSAGFRGADILRVRSLIQRNEFKRRQCPVGPIISKKGFGSLRRYPITNAYKSVF